jgi:hypothetical protein
MCTHRGACRAHVVRLRRCVGGAAARAAASPPAASQPHRQRVRAGFRKMLTRKLMYLT